MFRLPLEDFRVTTNGQALGGHRVVQGFVPPYVDLAEEASDSDFNQKLYPQYPLTLSPKLTNIAAKTDAYPVITIPNTSNALGKVIYFTNLWKCYSDDTTETDLGIPNGTPASNVGIDALIYNGKILTSHPTSTALYHGAISSSPSWSATTGETLAANARIMKRFAQNVHVTNASSGSFSRNDQIYTVLSDFSIETGLELGDTWHIVDFENYLDRYELVFCENTKGPRLSPYTTVFLWDGISSSSYGQSFTLDGVYQTAIVKNGITYAFTQQGTTLVGFYFDGMRFQEFGRLRNTRVGGVSTIPKTKISIEGDYFVLLASSPGVVTRDTPLYWKPSTGEAFYLLPAISDWSYGVSIDRSYETLAIGQDTTGRYKRYVSYTDTNGDGRLLSADLSDVGLENVTDFHSIDQKNSDYILHDGNWVRLGQTFSASGGKLTHASFYLAKVGSPTGDVRATLYATSSGGAPTGSPLATSANAIDITTLATTSSEENFLFNSYQLTAQTTYAIVVNYSGGDGTNYLKVGTDSTTGHSGTPYSYQSSWASTTNDLVFSVTEYMTASGSYKSNVIPAPRFEKDVHKNMPLGRMQIENVNIEYNTKPPSSTDSMSFTLTYKDEYTNETYDTYTATIKDTTANSTNANVDTKRAIINPGVIATEFSIDLDVSPTTTTWKPIIRRIVVEYKPIQLQT